MLRVYGHQKHILSARGLSLYVITSLESDVYRRQILTLESDVYRRQILTYKDSPRAYRIK